MSSDIFTILSLQKCKKRYNFNNKDASKFDNCYIRITFCYKKAVSCILMHRHYLVTVLFGRNPYRVLEYFVKRTH